ncbi:MAG: methyl-accepting chemotaxis protein [Herbinix sp.]|jgi:methyl-accepting chemotaxis protein|nr:methyl-accepting chemotaxis protein [Herbinix sp.]
MNSVKTKLLLYFTALILLLSIFLGTVSVQVSSKALQDESEKALATMAYDTARLSESRIVTQKTTMEVLASNPDMQSMVWEDQQPILKQQLETTGFLDIGVLQLDGSVSYTDGSTNQLGDREYVKKALAGETNVSDLLISRVTNSLVLMYATPIKKDGKIVGALVGRRDGDALSSIIEDAGLGESGYAYMINSSGTMIAHPDREKVFEQWNPLKASIEDKSLQSVATLFEHIIAEKTGVREYEFDGKVLYAGYTPVEGSDWYLVITADKSEVLSAVGPLQRIILFVALFLMAAGVALALFIGNSLVNPIIQSVKHSERIAALDITQDIPHKYLIRKDEIGTLSKAMQVVTDKLRQIIGDIHNSSELVAASSEELTAASEQSASAAEEISLTIQQIAKSASDQAKDTEEGSLKASLLGEAIEKDFGYRKELNTATNKVTSVVEEGLHEIDELTKITGESMVATKEIFDVIIKTKDSSEKIEQASSVIASIAQQTNLLALNASIEAARAGEAGRGFTVVAEQIKKLAEQSSVSTKEIKYIVEELQNNALNAVKTMERVSDITKEQADSVENNKNKYLLIAQAMRDSVSTVERMNVSGEAMDKMKNDIIETFLNISSIVEEYSAATEEVTASMEEQTATVVEIAGASEDLSTLAQNLQDLIMKFQIKR